VQMSGDSYARTRMPDLASTRTALRALFGLMIFLIMAGTPVSSVKTDMSDLSAIGLILVIFLLAMMYGRVRRMLPLEMICECWAIGLAASIMAIMLSYLAASFNQPMTDDLLKSFDHALGFDWASYARTVDASPFLVKWFFHAYASMAKQLLFIPVLLIIIKQAPRAYVMLASFLLLVLISCFIFIWMPAIGAFHSSGMLASELTSIRAAGVYNWVPQLLAVRSAETFEFDLARAGGIISMPSVHAGTALICAWAGWRIPVVKYVLVAWNLFMSASTIFVGSHYLVDILVGWAVGALAIYGVLRACRWHESQRDRTSDVEPPAASFEAKA